MSNSPQLVWRTFIELFSHSGNVMGSKNREKQAESSDTELVCIGNPAYYPHRSWTASRETINLLVCQKQTSSKFRCSPLVALVQLTRSLQSPINE
jgi:hypothetical protein